MCNNRNENKCTVENFYSENDFQFVGYFISVLIFLFSCSRPQELSIPSSFNPKVVEAKGYVVPKDSLDEPKVILIDESKLKKIPVGKPKVVLIHSNIHLAGTPKVIKAGIPRVSTPGQDIYSLPETYSAIDNPIVAGIPEVVLAKDPAMKDQNPHSFSNFSEMQGLPFGYIECMLQDKNGNIWFGIWGSGVTKYDGKNFTHFTVKEGLPQDNIRCMLQDKNENIWFGNYASGVSKYDGKSFTHFTEKEGFSNNGVTSILEDKNGNVWFGTYGSGVIKYDGKSFTHFTEKEGLSNNYVFSILEDNSGILWFGAGEGISKYDGKSFMHYTQNEGLSNKWVSKILQDKNGHFWFGTFGGGVIKYDGENFMQFTEKEGLFSNAVISMLFDKNGNLWIGTEGGGINKYDGKRFTYFSEEEGLFNHNVGSILEDKSGNLWFGSQAGGVSKYDAKGFTHFTEQDGLPRDFVTSILEDKSGNLWFGTHRGGVSKYNRKNFTHFTEREGLSNNIIRNIFQDRSGHLWFGSQGGGLSKYDGKYFTHYTAKEGLVNNYITSMLQDKNGDLWIGTWGGVSKYDGSSFTNYTTKEGMSNSSVMDLLQDKTGNIWFATYGGGVTKYDWKAFTHFKEQDGLSNNTVMSIMEDQYGDLWIGTLGGGVNKYDGKSFTYFSEREGLSNNFVLSMLEDSSGNLWFGTQFGLNQLTREKLSAFNKIITDSTQPPAIRNNKFFKNYTYDDGFQGVSCYQNSICQDRNGTIWIGANDRLTAFRPPVDGETFDTTRPNIQLNGIQLFNENIGWANLEAKKDSTFILGNGVKVGGIKFDGITKWYGLPEHLSLAHNNNNITFNYIGITMHQPKKVRYQYKMEGNDENWNSITNRTDAAYGNLSPGKYTFQVKAMNSEGYWSHEYHYPFIIRPPWWLTWWAYSLYGMTFLSLLYTGQRYQKQRTISAEQKKAEQKQAILNERLRISRDLHDEVGATLSGIVMYSHLAKSQAEQGIKEVENSLNIVQETASEMVGKLNDVVWLINPLQDTIEKLLQRLEEYATLTASAKNMNVSISDPGPLADIVLPVETRKNIYLICKEAINNAVKYSEGSMIELSVTRTEDIMEFTIKDDGIGFDPDNIKRGNGLNNMQQRADDIGAEIRFQKNSMSGTTLFLKCKIAQMGYARGA